ncbi:MAG: PaaI family thioesterase [Spirochaetia bacterium]
MGTNIENDDTCFCCGRENEKGLAMVITYPKEGMADSVLTIPEYFSGWKQMVHGGFLSMVLDEIMAHACLSAGAPGVTAELTVRFRQPGKVGTEIQVSGEVESRKGRMITTIGTIRDAEGKVLASAKAKFMAQNKE